MINPTTQKVGKTGILTLSLIRITGQLAQFMILIQIIRRFARKVLGIPMRGLLLVFSTAGLQDARTDEADEAYKAGLKYYNGEDVNQDHAEAFKECRKAAYKAYETGLKYYNGLGVTQNHAVALKWFQKAAVHGLAAAQRNIGFMYENGDGVGQDIAKALKWFKKAADQGDVEAQYWIGMMYYNGLGVAQNYAVAFKWFRKAADQGNFAAERLLESIQ